MHVCAQGRTCKRRQQRKLDEMSDRMTVEHNKHSQSNEQAAASKGRIVLTVASLHSATTSRLLICSVWSPGLKITQLPTCDAECFQLNKSSKRTVNTSWETWPLRLCLPWNVSVRMSVERFLNSGESNKSGRDVQLRRFQTKHDQWRKCEMTQDQ